MSDRVDPSFYQAEAAITDPAAACYVERPADAELRRVLREGKYTVILSSRKVGKSSLIERGFEALRNEGILVARHELTVADASVTPEGWYGGLANGLVQDAHDRNGFEVAPHWWDWWRERSVLPPGERFKDFLRTFLLEPADRPWVIAIDEIDTTIPLTFSDDFFALLRSCQNARSPRSPFRHLTFLLAGVATPSQLIKDNRRTPFNIGHYIQLTDFSAAEAEVFMEGLGEPRSAEHPALQRVLHWTGGHPYLTQRVFQQLAEKLAQDPPAGKPDWPSLVDAEVHASFLRPGSRSTEPHLEDIARRRIGELDKRTNPRRNSDFKHAILEAWKLALRGRSIRDDRQAAHLVELKLCGLLVPKRNDPERLVIRNEIYQQVFDARWVAQEMPRIAVDAAKFELKLRIKSLKHAITTAQVDVPHDAYEQLKVLPRMGRTADHLLAEYWKRRALCASLERPRDEAAVLWLKALSMSVDPLANIQARQAWAGSLAQLDMSFRHSITVRHAEFSSDGQRIVTASDDRTAQIWDARTGQPLAAPLQHESRVLHVEFSPDGQHILTVSSGGTARIWDAHTGQPLAMPLQHRDRIRHAEFSPDGQRIVTVSDYRARIWDARTGQPLTPPLQHEGRVRHAEFSPDGQRIVTASDDGTARIWDARNGQPLAMPLPHRDRVLHAEFSPDRQRIVTAGDDGTARIWDARTGQPLAAWLQHEGRVRHAEFSPDGQLIVTACDDGTAWIWDACTGQPLAMPLQHKDWIRHAEFSPDGQRIVTASDDGTARIWDACTGQPLAAPLQHEGGVLHAEFSPDGQRIVTASDDGTARIWAAHTRQPLAAPLQHEGRAHHAEFSPDGQLIVTACDDGTAWIWDACTGQSLAATLPHAGRVLHTEFSPDGQRIVTASDDGTARIWDAYTGQPLAIPLQHRDWVLHAEFSPDGQRIVTTSYDGTARIWDARTGQPLAIPLQHKGRVLHAEFSPDGQRTVTTSDDRTRVWETRTREPLAIPLEHEGRVAHTEQPHAATPYHEVRVHHAEFSPDGKRIVTACDDGTAWIWDACTGQPLAAPLSHEDKVLHAEFSPEGERIVTASDDGTARVWDARTGQPLALPLQHGHPVNHAQFSPDGKRIVSRTFHNLAWWVPGETGTWRPEAIAWTNGGPWQSRPALLDATGTAVRILEAWTNSVLLLRGLSPHAAEASLPELSALPAELLEAALQRCSLEFELDERGRIGSTLRPRYLIV